MNKLYHRSFSRPPGTCQACQQYGRAFTQKYEQQYAPGENHMERKDSGRKQDTDTYTCRYSRASQYNGLHKRDPSSLKRGSSHACQYAEVTPPVPERDDEHVVQKYNEYGQNNSYHSGRCAQKRLHILLCDIGSLQSVYKRCHKNRQHCKQDRCSQYARYR